MRNFYEFDYKALSKEHIYTIYYMYIDKKKLREDYAKKQIKLTKSGRSEKYCESLFALARNQEEFAMIEKIFEICQLALAKIKTRDRIMLLARIKGNPKAKKILNIDERTFFRHSEVATQQLGYFLARHLSTSNCDLIKSLSSIYDGYFYNAYTRLHNKRNVKPKGIIKNEEK